MRIKSYFAESIRAAMEEARRELGPDAVLVNSKRLSGPGESPRYEVVFGTTASAAPVQTVSAPPPLPPPLPAPVPPPLPPPMPALLVPEPSKSMGLSELTELREQVSEIQAMLREAMEPRRQTWRASNELRMWDEKLRSLDFESAASRKILFAAADRLKANPAFPHVSEHDVNEAVRCELESNIPEIDPSRMLPESKVILLVGPPGAGKTTAIANLAMQYGLAQDRAVHLISFDPHRPVGAEKLEQLASILDVPFSSQHSQTGLLEALGARSGDALAFIDVPGYSLREEKEVSELLAVMQCVDGLQSHLVLPTSMKSRELIRYAQFYANFRPLSVIATRCDESPEFGGILSVCLMAALPLSLTIWGHEIPGSLQSAALSNLIDDICGPLKRAVSAA